VKRPSGLPYGKVLRIGCRRADLAVLSFGHSTDVHRRCVGYANPLCLEKFGLQFFHIFRKEIKDASSAVPWYDRRYISYFDRKDCTHYQFTCPRSSWTNGSNSRDLREQCHL